MVRQLKALGLALVAVFAFGAASASGPSAQVSLCEAALATRGGPSVTASPSADPDLRFQPHGGFGLRRMLREGGPASDSLPVLPVGAV
jgi:hypothetical protein